MHLGRYEVIRKIGAGGFGEVLLARALGAEGFERIVAVKRLKGELARREGSLQGIINEARIGGLLNHPNVVQVLEFIQVGTDYLLVMEYVDGIGLQELLDLERTNVQLLEPRHAFDIIIQACEGLNYAHSARSVTGQPLKLIHRDIKPSNLMITRTGTVKVMDFGVARSVTNKGQSSTGSIKGTLRYLSPEQAEGSKEIGHESDLFSLGLVLCEMLIKRPVYEADQEHLVLLKALQGRTQDAIAEAEQKVPGTGPILRKCLANQPDERYRSADELAQALRNLKSRYAQGEGLARLVDDALAVRKQDNFDDEVSTDTTFSLELRRKELGLPRPGWEMLKSEAPTEQLSRAAVKIAIKQALAEEPRNIEDLMESAPWEWEWRVAESDTSNPWMGDAFDRAAPPSGLGIPLTPPGDETKAPSLDATASAPRSPAAESPRETAHAKATGPDDLITTQIKARNGVHGSRSEAQQTSPKVVSLWGAVLPAMSPAVAEPGARGAQRGEGAAAASAASPTLVAGLRPQAATVPIEERRTLVGNPLSARAEHSPGAGIRETPAAFPPVIPLYTPENSPLNVNGSVTSTSPRPPAAPEQVLEAEAPTPIRPSAAARSRALPRVDEHSRTQEMLPITQRVARRLDPPAFAAAAEAAPVLTRTAPMPKMQVASAAVAEVPEEIEEMEAEESGIFDLEDLLADPLSVPPSQRTLSLKAGVVKLNGAPQNVEAIRKNAAILAGSGQTGSATETVTSDQRVPSSAPVPPPPSAAEAEAVEEAPLEAGSEEDEDEEWSVVASGASEEAEEAVAAAPASVSAPASTSKMAPVGGPAPAMPESAPKIAVSAAASSPETPTPAPVVAAPPELSVPPAFADEAQADRAETPTVERVIPYGGIRRANLQKIKGSPMPFVSETGEFRVLRRPAEQENLAEQTLSGQTLSGQTLTGQTPADRTLKTSANESIAGELSDKGQSEKSQLELGLTDAGIKPSLPEWDSKTHTTQAGRASAGKTEPRAGLAAVAGAESDDMLAENSTVSRFFVPMEPQTRTVVLNSDGLNAAEEGDGTRVLTPNRPARSSQGPLLSVLEAPHPEQTGLSPRQFVLGFMLGVGLLAAGFLLGVVWERSHTGGRLPDPQVSVPRP